MTVRSHSASLGCPPRRALGAADDGAGALDAVVALDCRQIDLDQVRRDAGRRCGEDRPGGRISAHALVSALRDLRGELCHGGGALGNLERHVRRPGERFSDQRVAHLGLEILRHAEGGEHVLVGHRVLVRERRRPVAQGLRLRDGAGGAVPVVREPGGHGRERRGHLGHEGGDGAAAGSGRLRGDRVEELLERGVRVGHRAILSDPARRVTGPAFPSNSLLRGRAQNSPTVFPLSSMSTSNAAGFTPRPGIVCMSPSSGTSQPEPV